MATAKVDCKVVLLGKEYGGKTSLVERFVHGKFQDGNGSYQSTIGAAFAAKRISLGKDTVTLGIWDTAGSERYEAMSRIYYRGAKAAIVCYDLTEESSFERAKFWIDELKANEENCFIFLCGTKLDLVQDASHQRSVDMNRVKAEIHAEEYFDTSSKTGENIEELFQKIGEFYQGLKSTVNNTNQDNIDLIGPSFTKKNGCCNSK